MFVCDIQIDRERGRERERERDRQTDRETDRESIIFVCVLKKPTNVKGSRRRL